MSAFVIPDYWKKRLEKFLETLQTPLHYKPPKYFNHYFWVFWSQDDDDHHHEILQQQQGFQIHNNNNDSLSAEVDTRRMMMISDKIKHAFLCAHDDGYSIGTFIIQFWAPTVKTIGGRRLLSTSGQPFAVNLPSENLSKYRQRCMEYQYSINHDDDDDPMAMVISSDAPTASTAFLNRLPQFVSFENLKGTSSPLVDSALECHLSYSYMLPICFPSQTTSSSSCIGVLEFSTAFILGYSNTIMLMIRALKEVGLGVFEIQERIPYQIIHGLKPVRDEIEHALRIVCESNDIHLAQVWITLVDDNHVSLLSYSEATRKKQMLSLKLTGHLDDRDCKVYDQDVPYNQYSELCDMFSLETRETFVGKTLEDYIPRFCNDVSKLSGYTFIKQLFDLAEPRFSILAICLNSIHTGDYCYAFEFLWEEDPYSDVKFVEDDSEEDPDSDIKSVNDDSEEDPDSDIKSVEDDSDSNVKFVEKLLSKLKELLPSFKLASGAELGDELDFISVDDSTATETKFLKIFQGERLSPITEVLEEGRRIPVPVVADYIEPLEAKSKKTPIPLSREVIEQQFVNTDEIEAAEKLKGAKLVEEFNVSGVEFVEISSQISSYMNYPQQSVKEIQRLDNYVAPSERTCTITQTLLPQEVTEGLFENIIEEATQKEPGDESDVPDVENSTRNEKTLQENILLLVPEASERGKKTMVEKAPSPRKYKTAPIHLSKEAIEHQFGNTMKEAAESLKVSISTLKRKCKDFGISEWQGRPRAAKRKVNDSSHQNNKNEEDIGAIEEPYAVNRNKDTLTIKAEYKGDMIKFHLCISEATFITVEEEIGKKFKLTHGTYKLKYLDEDKDWILLSSDEDMSVCIKSLRNLGRIVLRMCVLPSTQPICS